MIIGKHARIFFTLLSLALSSLTTLAYTAASAEDNWLTFEYFLDADIEEITAYTEDKLPFYEKRADEENDAEAQYTLARMYESGIVVKQDKIRAEKLYLQAANNNLDKAQLALAIFYNYKGDITKSRKWFNESAKSGNAKSLFQLGLFYEKGRGVFQNLEKAHEYYSKSSELGYVKASLKFATYYESLDPPDYRQAIIYYKRAAEQGDNQTKLKISILMARLYADIAKGQKNEEHVFKWLLKAAELGDIESQFNTAKNYLHGIGTLADYDNAIKWFKKATDQGHVESMTMLGYIYSNGIGVDVNYEESLVWYKYAAERGSDEAAWSMANMHLAGNGVPVSKKEADKWFKRAKILRKKKEILKAKNAENLN